MKDKKPRIVKAVSWVVVAVLVDLLLGLLYYLQYTPEFNPRTLALIYGAYIVLGTLSHYLLGRYIIQQEEKDGTCDRH